jgi:transposase, IS30 family
LAYFPAGKVEDMPVEEHKGKHLSYDEREEIRTSLKDGLSFKEIGLLLGRDPSTISKEVRKHRFAVPFKGKENVRENLCALKKNCKRKNVCNKKLQYRCKIPCRNCIGCNGLCPDFVEQTCLVTTKPPYVCNACSKQVRCILDKYYYASFGAHREYRQTLSYARQGIALDRDELVALDSLVSPLIKKGQPIAHIYTKHREEIGISERTLYKYIDSGYMAVINLDLQRMVRYRKRKKIKESVPDSKLKEGRHYVEFQKYLEEHPDTEVVEMDTVEGIKGGKLMLTMLFRKSNLMLAYLLPDKTKKTVAECIGCLEGELGTELFAMTYPIILTDNGVEFADPLLLETGIDGANRTRVFYCDPGKSCQKGSLEKNHEYIRYILPKGTSFNNLTGEKVLNMINHINSTARPGLNGKTPMALAELLLDYKVKEKLGLALIPADEVCLKPELLKL